MMMPSSFISFVFIVLTLSYVHCVLHNDSHNYINCNLKKFQKGCVDEEGSVCDSLTNKCICKNGYSIRMREYCFQPKYIGDKCWASVQCSHIPNAGCYNYREEYNHIPSAFFGYIQKNWPLGECRCKIGHRYESERRECVKKAIGSWCFNPWDCRLTDARMMNTVCEDNVCKCSPNYLYNQTSQECIYQETFGEQCIQEEACVYPSVCINGTCQCDQTTYHFDAGKTPRCQPNSNLNEQKRQETFQIDEGDKTFEIFVITCIPLIIIFFTIKPCCRKFAKCKPPHDEIICGSKEIKIKNSKIAINSPIHEQCDKGRHLTTIDETNEDTKEKEEIAISIEGNVHETSEKSIEGDNVEEKEDEKEEKEEKEEKDRKTEEIEPDMEGLQMNKCESNSIDCTDCAMSSTIDCKESLHVNDDHDHDACIMIMLTDNDNY